MTLKPECEGYGCIPADFLFVGISAGRLGALVTKVPFTKDASGRIFQRCLNRLGLSKSDEFSLQPEQDTWCSWKCSKCQMEVRIGVYE